MPIVEAVGVAVGRMSMSDAAHDRIEAAMTGAVRQAQAEGVADPDELRDRMLAARDAQRGD